MFVLACPVAKACSETEQHDGRSMLQNLLTSQKSGSQGRLEESLRTRRTFYWSVQN